ncbi:GIY-YIG nuclease family protein, partial [Aurantiacibacter aquimixticola]
ISPDRTTARGVIEELVPQLPPGWQATALSAVLILYKEKNDKYPQANVLARS